MRKLSWIKEIKAIGWDLDGTLYAPGKFPYAILKQEQYKAVAEKKGWGLAEAKREFDKAYARLCSHTKTLNSFGIDGEEFLVGQWDRDDLGEYLKRDKRLVQMFKQFNKKYRQFIISNTNRMDQIERKLKLLGLKIQLFEVVVSTYGMGAVKPDPEPFLVALEELKLKPKECLYVGDREATDIMGAKKAGMRTCLVWLNTKSEQADVTLQTVYDVAKLF